MNAESLLTRVALALAHVKLEAVLIGNAAAALHGAPVTTIDFDFMVRNTPANARKLRAFAALFEAGMGNPFYPVVKMTRVTSPEHHLQVDFVTSIHGIRSYESLRSRATTIHMGESTLTVASLVDVVKSKRAAGRPKDLAALPSLEATLDEIVKEQTEKSQPPKVPGRPARDK